jgi:hypothetical protein
VFGCRLIIIIIIIIIIIRLRIQIVLPSCAFVEVVRRNSVGEKLGGESQAFCATEYVCSIKRENNNFIQSKGDFHVVNRV